MIDDITASTMCKADEKSTACLVFSPQTQDSVCVYIAEGLVPELECFGTWFSAFSSAFIEQKIGGGGVNA